MCFNKFIPFSIGLLLIAELFVTSAASASTQISDNTGYEPVVTAQVTGSTLALDSLKTGSQSNQSFKAFSVEDTNKNLSVIVELTDKPLIDYCDNSIDNSDSDITAITDQLLANQSTIISAISSLVTGSPNNLQPSAQYTNIINAFIIDIPSKYIAEASKIPGVSNISLNQTYQCQSTDSTEASETDMQNASKILTNNDTSYKGSGQLIAVLDSELNVNHEAFANEPSSPALTKSDLADIIDGPIKLNASKENDHLLQDAYYSEKIPYAYNYADNNTVLSNTTVHGTHVAGITSGCTKDAEGNITFEGAAPDSQLIFMKILSTNTYYTDNKAVLSALEDCYILDVDVINLSFGSPAGFTGYGNLEPFSMDTIIDKLSKNGISIYASAGNESSSECLSSEPDFASTQNTDLSVVALPSTLSGNISVASMNNCYRNKSFLIADGQKFEFSNSSLSASMEDSTSTMSKEYVVIDGLGGEESDFYSAKGKIALVSRGTYTFEDKAANAAKAGAVGIIIYNNGPDDSYYNFQLETMKDIPVAFVSQETGNALKEISDKRIYAIDSIIKSASNKMSDFSSLGVLTNLTLKPEITAPGGSIYSSYPTTNNSYQYMSGTSMASPNMAGIAAEVRQYIGENDSLFENSSFELNEIANQLLISTAIPIVNTTSPSTSFYSPKKQGAGLVNAFNAINTPAYLSVSDTSLNENGRPILNIGDDEDKTGEYSITFQVNNISDSAVTYTLDSTALHPILNTEDTSLMYINAMQEANVTFAYTGNTVSTNGNTTSINIPAKSSIDLTVSITLSESEKTFMDTYFENGIYVEGYIRLLPTGSNTIPLSTPFLGYYGDWTSAPVFEHALWFDETPDYLHNIAKAYTTIGDIGDYPLGMNPFINEQDKYYSNNITISPNADSYFDSFSSFSLSLLRNAENINFIIEDSSKDQVYHNNYPYITKSLYNYILDAFDTFTDKTGWNGENISGGSLKEGTYTAEFKGSLQYRNADLEDSDMISFPITIDLTKPVLSDRSLKILTKDDKTYLTGSFTDHNLAYISAFTENTKEILFDDAMNSDTNTTSYDFAIDISNRLSDKIILTSVDFGLNEQDYEVDLSTLHTSIIETPVGTESPVVTGSPVSTESSENVEVSNSIEASDSSVVSGNIKEPLEHTQSTLENFVDQTITNRDVSITHQTPPITNTSSSSPQTGDVNNASIWLICSVVSILFLGKPIGNQRYPL